MSMSNRVAYKCATALGPVVFSVHLCIIKNLIGRCCVSITGIVSVTYRPYSMIMILFSSKGTPTCRILVAGLKLPAHADATLLRLRRPANFAFVLDAKLLGFVMPRFDE